MQISARNQIIGIVEKISLGAVNAEVLIKMRSGNTLVSIITNTATENLEIKVGDEVIAVIKSSNILLSTETNLKLSARNTLKGVIESINQGEINSEVVVNVGNEDKIVTVITTNSIKNMNLEIGTKVDAIIKASDIMIGR
jgi:molybdate transport system regulatory protein